MTMMTVSAPSATAAVWRCPQCNGPARLALVEPHASEPHKEWHVFSCESCSSSRAYLTSR